MALTQVAVLFLLPSSASAAQPWVAMKALIGSAKNRRVPQGKKTRACARTDHLSCADHTRHAAGRRALVPSLVNHDEDRLCLLWNGEIQAPCFAALAQPDGSVNLIRNERHITTTIGFEDGNTKDL